MKSYILTFILLLCMLGTALAQSTNCVRENDCLKIAYLGAERAGRDVTLSFTVTSKCKYDLSHASFELLSGKTATSPSNSNSNYKYSVSIGQNKGNPGFYSIKFDAKNARGYSNGASDTFSFTIPLADFQNMQTIRAEAKAGQQQLFASFATEGCQPAVGCRIDMGDAIFGFAGATAITGDLTEVRFRITNNLKRPVSYITIETPATEGTIGVTADSQTSYSALYNYDVSINQETHLITFTAQNAETYARGGTDTFVVTIPTAIYEEAPYFQLQMAAGSSIINTGFNLITCDDTPIDPLPVELVSFEGKATASGVNLEWSTASETDNEYFEVQRSTDGKDFAAIGRVQGAGNSTIALSYTYKDTHPEAGANYYRLKQVDFDGTSELSRVVAVEVKKPAAISRMEVYPNPTTSNYVRVALQNPGNALLQIMDMSGRQVYKQEVQQGTQELELTISELGIPKGLYYINLRGTNGRQTQKLVVQ